MNYRCARKYVKYFTTRLLPTYYLDANKIQNKILVRLNYVMYTVTLQLNLKLTVFYLLEILFNKPKQLK